MINGSIDKCIFRHKPLGKISPVVSYLLVRNIFNPKQVGRDAAPSSSQHHPLPQGTHPRGFNQHNEVQKPLEQFTVDSEWVEVQESYPIQPPKEVHNLLEQFNVVSEWAEAQESYPN